MMQNNGWRSSRTTDFLGISLYTIMYAGLLIFHTEGPLWHFANFFANFPSAPWYWELTRKPNSLFSSLARTFYLSNIIKL